MRKQDGSGFRESAVIVARPQPLKGQHSGFEEKILSLACREDLGQELTRLAGIEAPDVVLAVDIVSQIIQVVALTFDAETPVPGFIDREPSVTVEMASPGLVAELLAVAVKLLLIGEASIGLEIAGKESLPVVELDQRIDARSDHGRDGQVLRRRQGQIVGLFVKHADFGGDAHVGGQKSAATRSGRIGVSEIRHVDDRNALYLENGVLIGDHLRVLVLDGPAGSQRPGRGLGFIVLADPASGIDDLLEGVHHPVAPDGG